MINLQTMQSMHGQQFVFRKALKLTHFGAVFAGCCSFFLIRATCVPNDLDSQLGVLNYHSVVIISITSLLAHVS